MTTTRSLLLVAVGAFLLTLGSNSRGQVLAPEKVAPLGLPPGDFVPATPAARDQRDSELDWQVQSLLKKVSEAKDDAAKADLQKKLSEVLGKQFDLRQELREKELQALEDRVKKLRELLDKRQKAKDTILRTRLDQLLREAEGLGWGDSPQDARKFHSIEPSMRRTPSADSGLRGS